MKRKVCLFTHLSTPVVVMAAVLCAIFFTCANLSIAASTESSPSTSAKRSAIDRTEARINDLHSTLKITPAQEELWNNLAQLMRDDAKTLDALIKTRAEIAKSMNAVEDLKSYAQITEAHAEGLKKFIPAFEALYGSMSDEQKKNADVLFKTQRHGKSKKK